MNPDVKAQWIADLRSGKYPQTLGVLHRTGENGGYCCLGVLCERALGEGLVRTESRHNIENETFYVSIVQEDGSRLDLPAAVREWAGIVTADPYVDDRDTLSAINDRGTKFDEIADLIERVL